MSSSSLTAALFAAISLTACGTVDPGPPTGPPMGCNGSTEFFITEIWPNYLEKYSCGKSDCHDYLTGKSSFRLKMPGPATSMNCPSGLAKCPASEWPEEWRFNYVNATRQLNCADPLSSRLLAKPEQSGTSHQGGTLVSGTEADDAERLFTMWATRQ